MIKRVPIGLNFPLRLGSTGYFEQSYDSITKIKVNLINFFLTKKGERPLNPRFGSDLFSVLYSSNNEEADFLVNEIIKNEITEIFPELEFVSSKIDNSELNEYKKNILISVKERRTQEQINFNIST